MNQSHLSSVSPRRRTVGPRAHGRAGRVCAVAVTTVMLLSGCAGSSGEEESPKAGESPAVSASPTPTMSSTPTPTPTPVYKPASAEGPAENVPLPKLPAEAKEETKAGLEAFAKYWYEVVEYAYKTGDLKPLKEISGPNCTSCEYAYNIVEQGFENEDWLVGGEFKFSSEDTNFRKTPEGLYQILLQVTQSQVTSYAGDGSVASVLTEEPPAVQIMEATFNGGWTAENVETISQL